MESTKNGASFELLPWLVIHSDGAVERLVGYEVSSPGFDPETRVLSKDIVIQPESGLSARIYRPDPIQPGQKLPLVVYFHGGAFLVASAAEPKYHTSLNKLVAQANIIAVSVNYRLAPEHPLPTVYEDSWTALQWIQSHETQPRSGLCEPWIHDYANFNQFFLVGDSSGANISHHLAFWVNGSNTDQNFKIKGIGMIHPYFWGTEPIGSENIDNARRKMVDEWWKFVCPSDKNSDDPWINPFVDGSPSLEGLTCERVLVIIAENDILKDRGKMYMEKLIKSDWKGTVEMMETKEKDHVFHIFEPDCEEAKELVTHLAAFINQDTNHRLV